MYCNKCGTKLDDDAQFCVKCGAKVQKREDVAALSNPENTGSDETEKIQESQEQREVQNTQEIQGQQESLEQQEKNYKKTGKK